MNTEFEISVTAAEILNRLLSATHERTASAPRDKRGIYGLVDHHGTLRYIGSTASLSQTLYERIHQRHRTGSENSSHYFSRMYNTGRMWRLPKDAETHADGAIAKALRNAFIAEHCRAVWVPLPDNADIAGLERAVIDLAPNEAIAWNWRSTGVYPEPEDLVAETIARLGLSPHERDALERQKQRYIQASFSTIVPSLPKAKVRGSVPPFPKGPFRFFALDVETANHDRGSICQIGVACVRPDNTIITWVTYVDPQVDRWAFTYLHGIDAKTVRGAPQFREILPVLTDALRDCVVYQHSSFDRTAIAAACRSAGVSEPAWDWKDSVQVARCAWPELKGNGGHGLASLKAHLGLSFEHHDAGEDDRAAAEVVLFAEAGRRINIVVSPANDDTFDVIEEIEATICLAVEAPSVSFDQPPHLGLVGQSTLTSGNIKNNHIYLRGFFDAFPSEVIGGSNAATAASRTISVDWGGDSVVVTDLDGEKKLFRKRGWVREFFARTYAIAGDTVLVERVDSYSYKVRMQRK